MSNLIIPDSWAEAKIDDVSEKVLQSSPKVTFDYIDIESVDNKINQITNPKRLSPKDAPSRAKKNVKDGDVIFSTVRPMLKNIALVAGFENPVASTGFCVIRPKTLISNFVFFYLRSNLFMNCIEPLQKGASYPAISDTIIYEQLIPVPPTGEQERIVQKIESCFEKINGTEKNFYALEKLFEKLSLSYLNKNGAWLEFVPLEILTEERIEKIGIKNPPNRKIGVDNELGVLDLRVTGKNNFEKYKIVKYGDILYNPMRINVGSLALYLGPEDAITSPDYIVFKVKDNYSKWLIFKYLKSSFGSEEISKKLTGSVRERLYYKKLKEILFPNPAIEKHLEAEKLLSCIYSQLIINKTQLKQLTQKLKESILTKAFEGRLVEQIRSEGTGQELLREILSQKKIEFSKSQSINSAKPKKKK